MGWGCQAKKCSLKSLFLWSHLIRFCFSLQNCSSFAVVIYIERWNAGCQAKCEKLTTSCAHVVLFWPLGQSGSWLPGAKMTSLTTITWPQTLLTCWDLFSYIHNLYIRYQRQMASDSKILMRWRKKTFLVCAHHCHHNNNHIRTHTNTQIQVKTVLSINNRQWADGTLVTSDTLNRLPAVDGLRSFHSLSNRHRQTCRHTQGHTHTGSAKHLLFLTPAGCEREHSRGENTKEQALTWERD